jgi:deoxyribodipyrimidine photo-lyase
MTDPTRPSSSPDAGLALVWLRRDLRLDDHAALATALTHADRVALCFVFDRSILDPLPRSDRRVAFIRESLIELDHRLRQLGGALWVTHGEPAEAIPALALRLGARVVVAAHDYEPAAISRDREVASRLAASGRELITCKDHAIFDRSEVLTLDGRPFSVFSPYKRAWLRALEAAPDAVARQDTTLTGRLLAPQPGIDGPTAWHQAGVPTLETLGFMPVQLADVGITPGTSGAEKLLSDFGSRIGRYGETRDFPGVKGPSYLSVHMRFGTLSVRHAARLARHAIESDPAARAGADTWLSELIWRDFYFQILWHHPRVVERAFRAEYDTIRWTDDQALFAAWCEGRTGYPLIDAAMAQINRTGYMHNRLRMVVASFLTKDLGLDWRWGERYFADHLIDFDLSANNGGWQWASSSGCDAQPYFRIFNPVTQSQRFDPEGRFIRRYLPQLANLSNKDIHAPWLAPSMVLAGAGVTLGRDYPRPVVDHDQARQATLARYAVVKSKAVG